MILPFTKPFTEAFRERLVNAFMNGVHSVNGCERSAPKSRKRKGNGVNAAVHVHKMTYPRSLPPVS